MVRLASVAMPECDSVQDALGDGGRDVFDLLCRRIAISNRTVLGLVRRRMASRKKGVIGVGGEHRRANGEGEYQQRR
jgi:hypothetical protein